MYPQLFLRTAEIMLFQPYLLVVRSSNTSGYVKKTRGVPNQERICCHE
jgi:hypothetical protein